MNNRQVISVFLLCTGVAIGQTSIVAIRTHDTVVIGADSKINRADHSETWNSCKIKSANNVFWGYARILAVPSRSFDVSSIAARAMSGTGTTSERVSNFEEALVPQLTQIMADLKKGDPVWFQANAENQSVVEIVFVAFEAHVSYMLLRYFKARSYGLGVQIETVRKDCPGAECKDAGYAAIGHHIAVDAELARNPAIWRKMGLVKAVQYLVQSEMNSYPDVVGPPIAILELTAQGPHWIQKGKCQ